MRNIDQILEDLKPHHKITSRPSWHAKWIGAAKLAALRSHDARTKCGCVLVDPTTQIIVAEGCNGYIRGIDDSILPNYEYNDDPLLSKDMIHGEINALLSAARLGRKTDGSVAYLTGYPCSNCYQALWQAGITHIYVPKHPQFINCLDNDTYKERMLLLNYLTKNQLQIEEVECNIVIAT